jgi:hypothetical protein
MLGIYTCTYEPFSLLCQTVLHDVQKPYCVAYTKLHIVDGVCVLFS